MLVRFWGGYAVALLALAGVLAAMGALGPAVQQMFLDAPQKKNVGGVEAIADALSGGWATQPKYDPSLTLWTSFLRFQSGPLLVSAVLLACVARPRLARSLVLAAFPLAFVLGNFTSFATVSVYNDLPRTFATLALAWLVVTPRDAERAFGVPREILLVLLALPLAMEWAMELSFPGRGWGEVASLLSGMLLVFMASQSVPRGAKLALAALLGVTSVLVYRDWRAGDQNPFGKFDYAEGTIAENHVAVDHPLLRGLKVNEARGHFLAWLRGRVSPGERCFVYGSMPALYDLLGCDNPSKLDTTAADFVTAADVDRAIAALDRAPPRWIIAQETHWMNPDLEVPFTGDEGMYSGLNPRASKALHRGLRSLLPRYELVDSSRDHLTSADLAWADRAPDQLGRVRLYRLRD